MKPLLHRLRVLFVSGVIILLPVWLTLYLLGVVFRFADGIVGRYVYPYLPFAIPGLGLVLTILIILLFGLLATNFLGRSVIRFAEMVILRTPIVRNVYTLTKQIVESLLLRRASAFKRVALIEYPRKGLYSFVFVTSAGHQEAEKHTGTSLVSVFLPTTPNPTSGFLLLVPSDDVMYLDMSVEDGIKTVISAGVVSNQEKSAPATAEWYASGVTRTGVRIP